MKTFKEFCVEAYQLDEFVSPKDIKSTLSRAKSAVTKSPVGRVASAVASNPVVKTTGRVLGGSLNVAFNRALGLEKLTTDDPNVGPVERGLGAVSVASPPGMSQATGIAHNIIGGSKTLKKADRALGQSHGRALKSNTQGYLQNLGMSF